MALDTLGAAPIVSLADGSVAADLCSRNYPVVRDEVIRGYPWNDAMARASLPALAVAPSWGFSYAYQLPNDCLRVVMSQNDFLARTIWRREGNAILTNDTGPLNISYLRSLDDPSLIGPLLARGIAARLSAVICYGVTGNASMTASVMQAAAASLVEAQRIDAREQSSDDALVGDDWVNSRYSPYGAGVGLPLYGF